MTRLVIAVAIMMTGCSATPPPREPLKPDARLLADCPVAEPGRNEAGRVVIGGMVDWSADLLHSLLRCNADKAALRAFYSEGDRGRSE